MSVHCGNDPIQLSEFHTKHSLNIFLTDGLIQPVWTKKKPRHCCLLFLNWDHVNMRSCHIQKHKLRFGIWQRHKGSVCWRCKSMHIRVRRLAQMAWRDMLSKEGQPLEGWRGGGVVWVGGHIQNFHPGDQSSKIVSDLNLYRIEIPFQAMHHLLLSPLMSSEKQPCFHLCFSQIIQIQLFKVYLLFSKKGKNWICPRGNVHSFILPLSYKWLWGWEGKESATVVRINWWG